MDSVLLDTDVLSYLFKQDSRLSAFLEPYTIINSDVELAHTWAVIRSEVMQGGRHIDTADCWIAATARLHGIPLLTHNSQHFVHVSGLITISKT